MIMMSPMMLLLMMPAIDGDADVAGVDARCLMLLLLMLLPDDAA